MCPHCGRDAQIVYRGAWPYCTACGRLRAPLSSPSINLAGKPSQVGGAVAKAFGWLVLLVGLSIALGVGFLVDAIATLTVALAIALPVGLIALVTGLVLLLSGRTLSHAGDDRARSTRDQALLELAAHRGGVTAVDASRALALTVGEADALLTELAKREPDRLTIDVDDQGLVWFRPARIPGPAFDARLRVAEAGGAEEARLEAEQDAEDAARSAVRR
ncbi:MAG: hypothetical protein JOZ69_11430 [Myxococcales bacterium]|nr:hypothetical protein [Myxococcales bacterium]